MSEHVGPSGPSRRWRWLLGVSLALNLLIIGAVGGAILRPGGPVRGGDIDRSEMRGFGAPYVRELPRATQRKLFRALRQQGQWPSRADRRAAYEEMIEALRAQPFDPSRPEKLLNAQAETVAVAQRTIQAAWLRHLTEMSNTQRAAYADRLEQRLRRTPRKER